MSHLAEGFRAELFPLNNGLQFTFLLIRNHPLITAVETLRRHDTIYVCEKFGFVTQSYDLTHSCAPPHKALDQNHNIGTPAQAQKSIGQLELNPARSH